MGKIYYKPENGFAADFIPFWDKGEFYLYYLHDYRDLDNQGEGTPWKLVKTKDFVNFTEMGEVLSRGDFLSQDLYVFTGSVFKKGENDYYLFYTGHNPHFTDKPKQAIMIATSSDLVSWQKRPELTFYADTNHYEPDDWRDPFVYFDNVSNKYAMLVASRLKAGGQRRRGCTVKLLSDDLLNWVIDKTFWAPDSFFTHECPDYFQIGKYWYLIFSEFSHKRTTQYRISENPEGPWLMPEDGGVLDGPAFYAAKTIKANGSRYLFGWNPTKQKSQDEGCWEWGGNLVVHELYQFPDGTLGQKLPLGVKQAFTETIFQSNIDFGEPGKSTCQVIDCDLPETYYISADLTFDHHVSFAGIALRYSELMDDSYWYVFEPKQNKFHFDKYPNEAWRFTNFLGLEKNFYLKPGIRHHLDIVVDKDVCVAYLDNKFALSSRMYVNQGMPLALISIDGESNFTNIVIKRANGR